MNDWQPELIAALGQVLVDFLWQGALIGVAAAIGLSLLRDARPQLRYALACLALFACVLAPALGLLHALGSDATVAGPQGRAVDVVRLSIQPLGPHLAGTGLDDLLPWIVATWAAGAGALSMRMTLGVCWIQRLRNTPQGRVHAAWQARLDILAARFGLDAIALRVVDTLDSPASAGWWRPVVLLPAALLSRMPVELIEALLAHELAHIRRHDYLVNLMQGAIEALLFYHPVTWWLSRRIRIERELIADQLAARALGEPRRLARALSELSEIRHLHSPSLHFAQAAHGGHLMSRIEQLIRPGRRTGGRIAFPLLGLAAACLAFYAHAQIGSADSAPPAKPATAATAPAHATRIHGGDRTRETFALVRKDSTGITMSGSTDDMPAIRRAKSALGSDFVWFRRDNRAWVVSDPSTVARAQEAWREVEKVGARMETLGSEMEVHSQRMEKLSQQMESAAPDEAMNAEMEAASKRMEALATQQEALAGKQAALAVSLAAGDQAERSKAEREMQSLSAQMESLSKQMEAESSRMQAESTRLESRLEPLNALSRQMEDASKPMEALSARMDALGKEHDSLARLAEGEMKALIDDAMSKGLATPAPAADDAR